MNNFIIIANELKFINKVISIAHPIKNVKIRGIYLTYEPPLKLTFNDLSNVYILSEYEYYKSGTRFPQNTRVIVLVNSMIKSRVQENVLFISHTISETSIRKNISTFLNDDTSFSKEKKVQKILTNFKFDFTLKGTKYLYESIIYCINSKDESICENLQKNVFSIIAEKYNTTPNNIKWNIIRSI